MDTHQEYYLLVYQLSEKAEIQQSYYEKDEDYKKENHERIRAVLSNTDIFPNAFQVMNTTWIIQYSSQKEIFEKIENFFKHEDSMIIIELLAKNVFFEGVDNEDKMAKCKNYINNTFSFLNYASHSQNV